jgi:AAA+ ATPase superfamily predicted ATPase
MKSFVNRKWELSKLKQIEKSKGGFIVLYGRRRVGKTALLSKWIENQNVGYSQAIEAHVELQLQQLTEDLGTVMDFPVPPKNWAQFFKQLKSFKSPWVLCLDEFQYLVQSAPELPSQLQKFLDHDLRKGCTVTIAGSSQSLMHSLISDSAQPLYGRSDLSLNIKPMLYRDFCNALEYDKKSRDSFLLFTMTGGLPRYWKVLDQLGFKDPVKVADTLYFEQGAPLEDEPDRILRDEGSMGQMARSILECVGRGSHRISEIAARLNQPATNLSRAIRLLVDLNLIEKELPFSASERESKSSLYRIGDPVLFFWYHVYSPMRSRWHRLSQAEKIKILHANAGNILERMVRGHFHGAKRYWESKFEWDVVREVKDRELMISEVKFHKISARERSTIIQNIQSQFQASKLNGKYSLSGIEIFDLDDALNLLS